MNKIKTPTQPHRIAVSTFGSNNIVVLKINVKEVKPCKQNGLISWSFFESVNTNLEDSDPDSSPSSNAG